MGIGPFDIERAQAVGIVLLCLLAVLFGVVAMTCVLARWRLAIVPLVVTFALVTCAGALALRRSEAAKAMGEAAGQDRSWGTSPISNERTRLGYYVQARRPADYGFRWALLPLSLGGLSFILLALRRDAPRLAWLLALAAATPAVFVTAATRQEREAPMPTPKYAFLADRESTALQDALEQVEAGNRRACHFVDSALLPFWGAEDRFEWPRQFRRQPHPDVADWRALSKRCVADFLDPHGTPAARGLVSTGFTVELLLKSPLLQDDAQRAELILRRARR